MGTVDIYDDEKKFENVEKYLHLIFDKPSIKNRQSNQICIQLMGATDIDETIMKCLEWWNYLSIGDQVWYDFENYRGLWLCEVKKIDGDVLVLEYSMYDGYIVEEIRVKRDCMQMIAPEFYWMNDDIDREYVSKKMLKRYNVSNYFQDNVQYVVIL